MPPRPESRVPVAPPTGDVVLDGLHEAPSALGVAAADGAFLVVADVGRERLRVVADRGRRRIVRAPRAPERRLRFVQAVGASFVVVSTDVGEAGAAWEFERIDAHTGETTGFARGERVDPLVSLRRATDGRRLLLAYATTSAPVRALLLDVSEPTLEVRSVPLRDPDDELGREVVAVGLRNEGHAVLFRRGVPEDDRGGVMLATNRGVVEVEALHELGLVERFERAGDEVTVVGSFEFDRPIAFRFGLDGALLRMERLAPGAWPGWIEPRVRADVEADAEGAHLRLRDASGDVLRTVTFPHTELAAPPAVTRDGHEFVVAVAPRAGDGFEIRVHRESAEVTPP